MSLFKSRTGADITGSDANSFSGNFKPLPDNTQATAAIKTFTIQEYEGETFFQVIWKLIDGEFKGSEVKQRIAPFDRDDNRAQRALNMLYRIFKLLGHRTDYEDVPTNEDLASMRNGILSIKIGNGVIEGQDRTWVREVWREGQLDVVTGETKETGSKPRTSAPSQSPAAASDQDSAFDRERKRREAAKNELPDDDIPF